MMHLATAARCGALAGSELVTLDAAKRLWKVALPLADTGAGRAIVLSPLSSLLKEMARGGVVDGGSVRTQVIRIVNLLARHSYRIGISTAMVSFDQARAMFTHGV